jgi:hypothetical protein
MTRLTKPLHRKLPDRDGRKLVVTLTPEGKLLMRRFYDRKATAYVIDLWRVWQTAGEGYLFPLDAMTKPAA